MTRSRLSDPFALVVLVVVGSPLVACGCGGSAGPAAGPPPLASARAAPAVRPREGARPGPRVAPPPASPAPPGEARFAVWPEAPQDGRVLAVLSTVARFDECSGAGGEHYVFELDDARSAAGQPVLVHGGGHALYLGLLPQWGVPATRWFAAELAMVPRTSEDRDDNPDSSVAGWCLDRLPRTRGEVLRLVEASDREAARRVVATLATTGLPRGRLVLREARGPETLAIVRVRARVPEVEGRFTVRRVEGAAPDVLEVAGSAPRPRPARLGGAPPFDPWTGDWLVVAVARDSAGASVVTRALLADDEADARRWRATIATRGWPPGPITVGWAGAAATARWAARGTVAPGNHACGPELRLETWQGSAFQLAPPRVAAPPQAEAGARLTVVVVPQPRDRCGRVARVVRAWVTTGEDPPTWVVGAGPEPSSARELP